MKKIYLLGSLFILLNASANAQNNTSSDSDSNSIAQTTVVDNEDEKNEFVLTKLIDELQNTLDVQIESKIDFLSLTIMSNNSNNAYTVNLKDNNGKTIMDFSLEPNTSLNFDLTAYPAENYLLRITDMSTLKMTVAKLDTL
jgi:hypothetical protein